MVNDRPSSRAWMAHPGLVAIAREAFDAKMPGPNQIDRRRDDVQVTAKELLTVPSGEITERGLCQNIYVGIQYMATWLEGNGCSPLYNLMEDAATAEISRAQLWQWVHQPNGILSDGRKVTPELIRKLFNEQMSKLEKALGAERFSRGKLRQARQLIEEIVLKDDFTEFMTPEKLFPAAEFASRQQALDHHRTEYTDNFPGLNPRISAVFQTKAAAVGQLV